MWLVGLVLLALFWTQNSLAANLFTYNADQTSTTSLGGIFSVGPRTSIDTNEKHSGTGSMRINFVAGDQTEQGIEPGNQDLGSGTDGGWLYNRFWMKVGPNFTWSNQNKTKAARAKSSGCGGAPFITPYLHVGGVYVGECGGCSPLGPGGGDPSPLQVAYDFNRVTNPAILNWHEYIFALKKQTGTNQNAELHFYVDGVEVGSATGVRLNPSGSWNYCEAWGSFMVRPLPQDASGTLWLDDFSLDTTFNSTFSGDTTPPAAPTGVTVTHWRP